MNGGYIIVNSAERVPWMSADLLPERLLSASTCTCPRVRAVWAVRWVDMTEAQRLESATAFWIVADRLPLGPLHLGNDQSQSAEPAGQTSSPAAAAFH